MTDQDLLLSKTDPKTKLEKTISYFVMMLAIFFSLFHLYLAGIGFMSIGASRHYHLIMSMTLIFLTTPLSKKSPRHWTFIVDVILIILAGAVGFYIESQDEIIHRRVGEPNTVDMIMGIIASLLTLEIVRRRIGIPLVITTLLFLGYAYFGDHIPGDFGHRGYDLDMMISSFYMEVRGIYGSTLGVVVEFVVLFVIFGSFLQYGGGGEFLIKLAHAMTGTLRGGPAKTAVIASGLMGSISGSPTANVVTTGSFTIPMMKKMGYPAHVAAGVEVASSVGGVIMPPIMGSAAFLIVALTSIPYNEVIKASIIPSLLYYASVYASVHFMACKYNLIGMPRDGSYWSNLWQVSKEGMRFIVPIVLLFGMLVAGYTPTYTCFLSLIVLVVMSALGHKNRMGLSAILKALEMGAKNALTVSAACACVGFIVGVVALTGVGVKFSSLITLGTGNSVFLSIIFIGLASLILGIELPITASYLVLAILAAPALQMLGVPELVSHLIVLWFSIDAAVTPPVCITSFVAAGVADAPPFKTALAGWRLAKGLYIIPFLMAFSPITLNGPWPEVVISTLTGLIGLVSLSATWEGWLLYEANLWQRIILGVCVLTCLDPGFWTDTLGITLFSSVLIWQVVANKRSMKTSGDIHG